MNHLDSITAYAKLNWLKE